MRWLLFLYPWLELWSLIQLGTETSPLWALTWVLGALMIGISVIRWAGRNSFQRLMQASAGGSLPQQLLMSDFALIFSGLFLAIPGLVSDALAVLILIGPFRRLIAAVWASQDAASMFHASPGTPQDDIIEGEYSVHSVREGNDQLEHSHGQKPSDIPK